MSRVLTQKTTAFSIELYIILYVPQNKANGKNKNVSEFMSLSLLREYLLLKSIAFQRSCFLYVLFLEEQTNSYIQIKL